MGNFNKKCKFISILIFIIIISQNAFARPKVAVVLSGGGARGYAHIALLKELERLEIPIDYIVGTSMGAFVGSLYSAGYSADDIVQMAKDEDIEDMIFHPLTTQAPIFSNKEKYANLSLQFDKSAFGLGDGIMSDSKILCFLERKFKNLGKLNSFNELPIPFRAVATDISVNREKVFSSGNLSEAVRASISIPLVFTSYKIGNHLYVDGGIVNNIPTDVAIREFEPDFIITMNIQNDDVSGDYKQKASKYLNEIEKTQTGYIDSIMKVLFISNNDKKYVQQSDIYLHPLLENYSMMDFSAFKEIMDLSSKTVKDNENKFLELKNQFKEDELKDYQVKKAEKIAQKQRNPIIKNIVIIDKSINKINVIKENLEGLTKKYKGIPFTDINAKQLEKELLTFQNYRGISSLAFFVDEIDSDNQADLRIQFYKYPIKKHQVKIKSNLRFSFNNYNLGGSRVSFFDKSGSTGLEYQYNFAKLDNNYLLFNFSYDSSKFITLSLLYNQAKIFPKADIHFYARGALLAGNLLHNANSIIYTDPNNYDYKFDCLVGLKLNIGNELFMNFHTNFYAFLYRKNTIILPHINYNNTIYDININLNLVYGQQQPYGYIMPNIWNIEGSGVFGYMSKDYLYYKWKACINGSIKLDKKITLAGKAFAGISRAHQDFKDSFFHTDSFYSLTGTLSNTGYTDIWYTNVYCQYDFVKSIIKTSLIGKISVGQYSASFFDKSPKNWFENSKNAAGIGVGLNISALNKMNALLSVSYEFINKIINISIELH